MVSQRLTIADLEQMTLVEGNLYELIDGVLHVSTQHHYHHQVTASNFHGHLWQWSSSPRGWLGWAGLGGGFPSNAGLATSTNADGRI